MLCGGGRGELGNRIRLKREYAGKCPLVQARRPLAGGIAKNKAAASAAAFRPISNKLSPFNPAGLQAVRANVHSPCTTVDFTFHASDVGIPDTVGSSMGMANVVTKMSAFATNIAFCHDCTSSNFISRLTDNISMIAEFGVFGKQNILKN